MSVTHKTPVQGGWQPKAAPVLKDRTTPFRLGLALIRLHLRGWRSVPGYTVTVREDADTIYVAMQLGRKR